MSQWTSMDLQGFGRGVGGQGGTRFFENAGCLWMCIVQACKNVGVTNALHSHWWNVHRAMWEVKILQSKRRKRQEQQLMTFPSRCPRGSDQEIVQFYYAFSTFWHHYLPNTDANQHNMYQNFLQWGQPICNKQKKTARIIQSDKLQQIKRKLLTIRAFDALRGFRAGPWSQFGRGPPVTDEGS